MKIAVTHSGPPGAAPVSENSVFRAVSSAGNTRSASITEKQSFYKMSALREVDLSGLWRRLAERGESMDKSFNPSLDDSSWPQVKVPDNFGLDGELQRHYGPVWYRRSFRPGQGKHADLIFQAVDYLADVWLNGEHLGHHEGYFAPFSFDVSKIIKESNTIAVKVQDPLEKLDSNVPVFLHYKKYIKGTMNYHDSRPGGLPGITSPKWTPEWGQSLTTGGITQPVLLRFTGPIRIDALFITPMNTTGTIHVAMVATNRETSHLRSTFDLRLSSPKVEEPEPRSEAKTLTAALTAELLPGPNRVDFDVSVPEPVLWWPCSHGKLGKPALYTLRVESICNAALSDVKVEQFGVRTVDLSPQPWVFSLNNKPIFVKASNYIPRQHFAGVDRSFYDRDMRLLKAANLNSVGIHGHVQCPSCYDAADDAGVLVFQDFTLQWSYDSCDETNPGFREKACMQIAEMAYQLYNHPSVVYWACHNEPPAMFLQKKETDPVKDSTNSVLDGLLETSLRNVDQSRPIHRSSGMGADTHIYDGSIGGGSIYNCRNHKEAGFVSEYGFWSIASTADEWGDIGWPPDKEELIQWSGRLSFLGSTSTYVGAPSRYPDRDSWINATQLYAAFLAKYQTETFRVRRGQPFNAIRWHFFVDWWGYAGAGLLDVNRIPKTPYYWLTMAQRPLLMVADLENTVFPPNAKLQIPVYIVNDSLEDLSVSWEIKLCRTEKSVVIAGDREASRLGSTMLPSPLGHMIALPETPPRTKLIEDKGEFSAPAESVNHIKTIEFTTPEEGDTPASFSVVMAWRRKEAANTQEETNWAHFLVATKMWKAQPGMQTVP
ncbi:MAG: glycoside hydrolase family 2 TIM barrel-domain containing protein [Promethearchaeati archaeon SRVP18_Atabeyarchaeia-1]